MLEHGGRRREAAARFGIALADWLDLSTGINPRGYPPPAVPSEHWLRLPEEDDGLEAAAAAYYGSTELLALAGSQAAIQALPRVLFPATKRPRIGILAPSYAEHARAWRTAELSAFGPAGIDEAIAHVDGLLLVHPNNPTGHRWPPAQLLAWHERLAARRGWLVIDEAFVDTTPELSLAAHAGAPGLVILRSLGKFFGLAGLRVGFVLAARPVRDGLREALGPWTLSGPSRFVATRALLDTGWQRETRARLEAEGKRLERLLLECGLGRSTGCSLFRYVECSDALELHRALAQQGILVRLFDRPAALRFGLPADEREWTRLAAGLHALARNRIRIPT